MQFFFSFFSLMCVQAQPSGTCHDGVSHPTVTQQAVTWLQRGGGGNVGSNTSLHNTQPPNSDTTSSAAAAAAAMRAAAHCRTTRNRPTATQRAVRQWQRCRQQHTAACNCLTATQRAAWWRRLLRSWLWTPTDYLFLYLIYLPFT